MNVNYSKFAGLAALLCVPGVAHAQYVPPWIVAAAISPLVVIVFAIILGLVSRSWRVGVTHVGLVFVWVMLFIIAAQLIENDYVIWTPIFLYAVHALLILILIIGNIARRVIARGRDS